MVERGDFEDLGQRELHFGRKRDDVRGANAAVMVLDPMQVLDQQIAPSRRGSEQRRDVGCGLGVDLAAFQAAAHGASLAQPGSVYHGFAGHRQSRRAVPRD